MNKVFWILKAVLASKRHEQNPENPIFRRSYN
jgi:hypothetical protein